MIQDIPVPVSESFELMYTLYGRPVSNFYVDGHRLMTKTCAIPAHIAIKYPLCSDNSFPTTNNT